MKHRLAFAAVAVLLAAGSQAPAGASPAPGPRPSLDILVGGRPLTTYHARGTSYVEAMKGREYEIRIRNPYPVRVAVALSVDGLNTIDARRTSAAAARKWVIEPHGAITISGWQMSLDQARRFEFTTEERSYGAWLGKTSDLGVITAVFFRERASEMVAPIRSPRRWRSEAPGAPGAESRPAGAPGSDVPAASANERQGDAGAAAAEVKGAAPGGTVDAGGTGSTGGALARRAAADDYAATGIGRRIEHGVRQVHLELETAPAASISIRYEYRAQLVRLGVLPDAPPRIDPLDRRERARGFEGGFCPEPGRRW